MSVLILGATSGMAQAIAEKFAIEEHDLFLAGRNADELEKLQQHFVTKYDIQVHTGLFDALKQKTHAELIDTVLTKLPSLDHVVVAMGSMGDHEQSIHKFSAANQVLQTNFTAVVSLLTPLADHFEQQQFGSITVLTSVAGDRGRQSNYIYGAAKGGLNVYLQGLRNRLYPAGVQVLTVKPGFVDTPMTYGMNLPPLLTATPQQVANDVYKAIRKRKDVIYTRWFWFWIMLIIRSIPEKIFKRLKL